MKNLAVIFLFLTFSFATTEGKEDNCVFDTQAQEEYRNEYIDNHSDSTLSEDGLSIIINRENEVISFRRGGCVHFGININATMKGRADFTESDLLNRAIAYIEEFGSALVDSNVVAKAIEEKNYRREERSNGVFYIVNVPLVVLFEISLVTKGGNTHIQVSFYIN